MLLLQSTRLLHSTAHGIAAPPWHRPSGAVCGGVRCCQGSSTTVHAMCSAHGMRCVHAPEPPRTTSGAAGHRPAPLSALELESQHACGSMHELYARGTSSHCKPVWRRRARPRPTKGRRRRRAQPWMLHPQASNPVCGASATQESAALITTTQAALHKVSTAATGPCGVCRSQQLPTS
jgi:hypothetical protein